MDSFVEDNAGRLFAAMREARAVEQISAGAVDAVDGAYAVQAQAIALRLADGERLVGMKMGFTSRAKMEQMGVSEMIFGRLTDAMQVADGGEIPHSRFIHPRVEPEIAFILGRPLRGDVTRDEARAAVSAICPAIELIDSRYRDFKFSLTDVVADNSSSAAFAVGQPVSPDLDINDLGVALAIDGAVRQAGSTQAILGDPWLSLIEAARFAGRYGFAIEAGQIVLAGAATEAVAIGAGSKVVAEIDGMAPVSMRVA